jgi:CheY-like chemotaxis protein
MVAGMNAKRIIIAEDDLSSARLLHEFLKSRGYEVEICYNGREALDKYTANPSSVVITDIEMPVMDGNELIDNLNRLDMPPVIFVTTAHTNPALIIDIMKKGVYDYIIKPIDMNDLMLKVVRAFETFDMKRSLEIMQREKVIRLERQLEWYRWEERAKSRDKKSVGDTLFNSLQTSFNQGAGFGALVSLVNIIASTAKKEGSNYLINEELFEVITQNAKMSEKALQTFADIEHIIAQKIELKPTKIESLYSGAASLVAEMEDQIALKKQQVIISDYKDNFDGLKINMTGALFKKFFSEVLVNALKFSVKETAIVVIFQIKDDLLVVSVINEPYNETGDIKGIPMEYENIVFEPFFRLTRTIQEEYKTLDYGLGLTLVEKIITKHGGKVSISNITDHSNVKTGPSQLFLQRHSRLLHE